MPLELITQREAAALLGIERTTLYHWQRKGKVVPAFTIGRRPLYDKQYIMALQPDKLRDRRRAISEEAA